MRINWVRIKQALLSIEGRVTIKLKLKGFWEQEPTRGENVQMWQTRVYLEELKPNLTKPIAIYMALVENK